MSTDIVITGMAAISAAGVGLDPLRKAVQEGKSLLKPIPPEIAGTDGCLWGKADAFKGGDFMPPLKARKFDRCSLFAVVAAGMALKDAGIDRASMDAERTGIVLGCGFGGIANSEAFLRGYFTSGAEGLSPVLFPNTVPNAPASNASIENGLKGPNVTFVQRFCSAESAVMMACRFLQEGRADVVLAGGVDEVTETMIKGFREVGQLKSHGAGFGEGAGILVLERGDHARSRKAMIKGTVGGIRTIGRLLPGRETEGAEVLLPKDSDTTLVSLSGTAAAEDVFLAHLPTVRRIETGPLIGRSLGMGGLAMAALVLSLEERAAGLHVAASPEGPYYAIRIRGGSPD
ncbi:beta-ketoacyl synthase N-terminal-like domain-containing protein [Geotalea sp. SG265]|uniref:beta-ketoacyl synthase N-terminal-like domain-containing protein n=1 Tax=Geotalea sp. SG265 TaxID=2922867 RepID=UPI001FAEC9FF|nr:beta-ketoacyl synthase N-terminal-like domain-containing protein [Geotalea sp. SG265]